MTQGSAFFFIRSAEGVHPHGAVRATQVRGVSAFHNAAVAGGAEAVPHGGAYLGVPGSHGAAAPRDGKAHKHPTRAEQVEGQCTAQDAEDAAAEATKRVHKHDREATEALDGPLTALQSEAGAGKVGVLHAEAVEALHYASLEVRREDVVTPHRDPRPPQELFRLQHAVEPVVQQEHHRRLRFGGHRRPATGGRSPGWQLPLRSTGAAPIWPRGCTSGAARRAAATRRSAHTRGSTAGPCPISA